MKWILHVLSAGIASLIIIVFASACKKTSNPIKYSQGTYPDSVINIEGINSAFDDYNLALNQITGYIPLVFSSNRESKGGQFDLVQALVTMSFNQETGDFTIEGGMTEDDFLKRLITKANTEGDDYGPYRLFSSVDGYEYMILSSFNGENKFDFYYTRNQPQYTGYIPEISDPAPVTLLNTVYNESYICFDANQDSAYFSSDTTGNYDIYVLGKPAEMAMDEWFNENHQPSNPVEILNSPLNDRCPFIYKKIMVFASDRADGFGGFDLYYSLFKNGSWTQPVNFGPRINTEYNEFRPVIGGTDDFTNLCMLFSSDRHGGKGGFDIYFTGIEIPE